MRLVGIVVCILLLLPAGCTASSNRQGQSHHTGKKTDNTKRAKPQKTSQESERGRTSEATSGISAGMTSEEPSERPEALIKLQKNLQTVATDSGSQVGIAVQGLDGAFKGRKIGVNQDHIFESASLIKVLILAELLREVDEGHISLDESLGGGTVGQLARSMITVSDNAATNLLIDRIGFDKVNALARNLGLKHTTLNRHMLDFQARARGEDNYTCASDMVTLFSDIWNGEFLSKDSRDYAISLLKDQELNTKIPAALPPGTTVAHKTGELEDNEHDAGIVVTPHREFAIAVLTKGDTSYGIAAIRRAVSLTYRTFSESS